MIALNIATLHILTKLFLKKFIVNNNGRIINIASLAALTPGPGFSSYYASKAYVLNLSVAINTELKLQKLTPRVITICPGPLKTDFWNRASANKVNKKRTKYTPAFPTMGISKFISKSLDKALATNNKNYIVIGFWNHLMLIISKILPKKLVLKKVYKHQINR